MAKQVNARIKLKTDTLSNWSTSTLSIMKGEMALGLNSDGKFQVKIGNDENGKTWNELPEGITIPVANVVGLDSALYDYQVVQLTNGNFQLQKRLHSAASTDPWTNVGNPFGYAFADATGGTGYNATTNPVALQGYVDEKVNAATTQYFETVRNEGETDAQAIARAVGSATVKGGSTCVIKTALAGTDPVKYEFIAFTYDTTTDSANPVWRAMDGNYNADNVYFTKNFSLAGDYTQVGNIKLSQGSYSAQGKSLKTVMEDIFDKTIQPTMGTAPSMSVSLTGAGVKEVGTTFTPSYSVTYTQGKYNTPWNGSTVNDDTAVTAYTVTDTSSHSATTQSGSFAAFTVADNTNYKVTASVTYGDGNVATDNKGQPSNPTVKRSGSSINNKTTSTVTGGRYTFYGIVTSKSTIDGSVIRGLSGKTFDNLSSTAVNVGTAMRVIVAIPAAYPTGATTSSYKAGTSLTGCIDVNDSNKEIISAWTKMTSTVNVNDASGANAIAYNVWYIDFADAHDTDQFKLTTK